MSISISQSINQSINLSFYLSICLSMYLTLSYSILPYLTLSFPILPYLILSFPFYSIFPILRMNVSWPCDALQGGGAAPCFFLLESYVGTAWVLSIFIYAVKAHERYRVILWTPLMWRFAGGGALVLFSGTWHWCPMHFQGEATCMALVLSTFCYFGSVARTHTHQTTTTKTAKKRTSQATKQPTNQATS